MLHNIQAVVLAGGTSTRFQTNKTKLIEKICGKEMIMYPLHLLNRLSIPTTLVVGFQHEKIKTVLQKYNTSHIDIVHQEHPLGTGHATSLTEDLWHEDHILIMGADTPLLTEEVITKLYKKHIKTDADISFITAHGIDDIGNKSYCKVIINDNKINVLDEPVQQEACCISGGVYLAKKSFLTKYINKLTKSSISNEYYLPELVQIASNNNYKVVTSPVPFDMVRCIDTLADLWAIEHIKQSQIIRYWMEKGVRFSHALNVVIDQDVIIESGAYIGSGVHVLGKSFVKKDSIIEAYAYIKDSTLQESSTVKSHAVITNSVIQKYATVEPLSHTHHQTITSPINNEESMHEANKFTGAIKTHKMDTK